MKDKVAAISQMPRPTNYTELRSFLGSLNYYRTFLPHLAKLVSPLTNILKGPARKKKTPIPWEAEHEEAYQEPIQALTFSTRLSFEDPELPLVLSTDASSTHVGAVLEQHMSASEESGLRPLCFFSKALPSHTTVRSAFNRELTALYFALRYFKHRVIGRELIVRTDHLSLV